MSCLVPIWGFAAACFASPAARILADLFLIPAYFHCYRTLSKPHSRPRRRIAAAA